MQNYDHTFAHIAALIQGDPNSTIIDVRFIHDTDKAVPGIPRRGLLPNLWDEICAWNNQGYGIFVNVNSLDGNGREIANVNIIRCQAVDLDNINALQDYERAVAFNPPPAFAVQSSPGKFHCYWQTRFHNNRDGFTLLQRKLRTLFNGDKTIIDPSRVLRLAGTYHLKIPSAPFLVQVWSLRGFGSVIDPSILEAALYNINVVDGHGGRHDLGDPSMQAPGLEWVMEALRVTDPNLLDRGEWISFTSAVKQAAWNWTTEQQIFDAWSVWCSHYITNDPAENLKQWNSIRNTEVGWSSLERRVPHLKAMRSLGAPTEPRPQSLSSAAIEPALPMPTTGEPLPPSGEFLSEAEQKEWFKGCVFITRQGEILTNDGRYLNSTKFNGAFGGKKFVIDTTGKVTTEAWQAATRSTLWQIPKADHVRFVPSLPHGELIKDALGRIGVNTYQPAIIDATLGDIAPFMRHMDLILPNTIDRDILFQYLAHNAKFPGYKIPWAPVIQSTEGAGKGVFRHIVQHMVGKVYFYSPKAQELIESGSKFNAWMRARLMILVDEIKVDERRDMIEILKPMISEEQIEVQAKGIDQDLEDNFANWIFFTNYKDAIPINSNSRRFSIFYSPIQSAGDLKERGMDDAYFQRLFAWLREGGDGHVVNWLRNYPIERGAIPMRAPLTTSTFEAVRQSRGPVETVVLDAIGDALPGFRGGWISHQAVLQRLKGSNVRHVTVKTLTVIMEAMGYHYLGRASRPYWQENKDQRSDLFHFDRNADVEGFGPSQGYG